MQTLKFDTISSNWKLFKNDRKFFYFPLKALFVLKIFIFLSWLFGHVEKQLDKTAKVNFKFFDAIGWEINNYSTQIAQYFKRWRQPDNKIWSVDKI